MSINTAIAAYLAARIKSNLIDEQSKQFVDQLIEIVTELNDLTSTYRPSSNEVDETLGAIVAAVQAKNMRDSVKACNIIRTWFGH